MGDIGIHTSDRNLFRRCRRKWDWQARNRQNLTQRDGAVSALWFGSGMHFVMEDLHGAQRFATPQDALAAYVAAFRRHELPEDWRELHALGNDIMAYYTDLWLPRRDNLRTAIKDGVPQVEVPFEIPLWDGVVYRGTFDRIVADEYDRLFVMDYKFMKRIDTAKLDHDPQITAYCWAASQFYGRQFDGVIYQQFRKEPYAPPEVLRNGELSRNKTQATTYSLYQQALKERYGDEEIPAKYNEFLIYLMMQEGEHGDAFIRRDVVYRNAHQIEAEGVKIIAEAREMTDPNLALYPNPTRDCSYCEFASVCLAMDDGSDWESMLHQEFVERQDLHEWRERIVWPDQAATLEDMSHVA